MSIGIILAGPRGKMGSTVSRMIDASSQFKLMACIDRIPSNSDLDKQTLNVPVYDDPAACFKEVNADVLVDFTVAEACFYHSNLAIRKNISPVIGTSGMTHHQVEELTVLAQTYKTGAIIAPNFSLGAVLMQELAKVAARYFPKAELVEKHHDQKIDAPSGTAKHIKNAIESNSGTNKASHGPNESLDVNIHSVRLPGMLAHHEAIFGGNGESLTLSHDSNNRDSFMDGVARAVEYVITIDYLVHGLEHIIMEEPT